MKKILVTGGNGFIGTNLILDLCKNKKNQVLNIDKISYSSNNFIIRHPIKNLKNIKLDLLNFNKLKKIIYSFRPEIIFHLAAETHVDVSLDNPVKHFKNNTMATLNLLTILQSALKDNILNKKFRFIHVGTDEIYGDLSLSSKRSFDEKQPLDPNNPYSCSKAAAVMMVKTWYKNFNFPCIITNSVNNFGYFQYIEKFIPRSILLAEKYNEIEVYGLGQNIRSWISAKDHASALIFLSQKGLIGQTYNISADYKVKNIHIAKKIQSLFKKIGKNINIKFVKDRLGHDLQYSINSSKLKRLGWKPRIKFNDEFKNVFNWFLDNKNLRFFKNINKHLLRKGIGK